MADLLAITVGPIDSFISAARRTRDLWTGSRLLSEIAKDVAYSIHQLEPGSLVFPYTDSPETDLRDTSSLAVSNVIVAVLQKANPETVAARASKRATDYWKRKAQDALDRLTTRACVDMDRWRAQLDGVLELYAAWEPLDPNDYRSSRARLMAKLAGRKACRDFDPWQGQARVRKSSLDGRRESVWVGGFDPEDLDEGDRRRLRLSPSEQLDAIGLTKRLGYGARVFPSVVRIAGEHFLDELERNNALNGLLDAAGRVSDKELTRLGFDFPQFGRFPFEAPALYRTDLDELRMLAPASSAGAWHNLATELNRLERAYKRPTPYFAVILADGDKMGATIGNLDSVARHREFSASLARFAGAAGHIFAKCQGALVFAGGDDVLGFVPIHCALSLATDLRDAFRTAMHAFPGPTLSVGVSIGHCREPLEDLLSRARSAEKSAKSPDRNGLAVLYAPRHQAGTIWRENWDSEPDVDMAQLVTFCEKSSFSRAVVKAAGDLNAHYRYWDAANPHLADALSSDFKRMIAAKKRDFSKEAFRYLEQRTKTLVTPQALTAFAAQLRIAHAIARAGELD